MKNPIIVKVRREQIGGGIAGVEPMVRAGAIDGLNAIGLAALATAKRKIQSGPASGKLYLKYGPKRLHQASAPGEAPATDTGGLVNSGFHEMDEAELEVHIGFAKFYAAFLEFGTRMMRKRPFLTPTMDEWRKKARAVMAAAIKAKVK